MNPSNECFMFQIGDFWSGWRLVPPPGGLSALPCPGVGLGRRFTGEDSCAHHTYKHSDGVHNGKDWSWIWEGLRIPEHVTHTSI